MIVCWRLLVVLELILVVEDCCRHQAASSWEKGWGERFGGDLGELEDEVGGRSGGEGVILEVGFWGDWMRFVVDMDLGENRRLKGIQIEEEGLDRLGEVQTIQWRIEKGGLMGTGKPVDGRK